MTGLPIGTCSLCGGPVVPVPHWFPNELQPPSVHCLHCGGLPIYGPGLPVIPMQPPGPPRHTVIAAQKTPPPPINEAEIWP